MYSIPKFNLFSSILHHDLYAKLYSRETWSGKFTLITNFIDRSPERIKKGEEVLLYAGVDAQRRIMEEYKNFEERNKDYDKNWNFLSNNVIHHDTPAIKTFEILESFRLGVLTISNINKESLADYFSKIHNEFKRNEYPILEYYFEEIATCQFLSIPIIAFGTIDGVVHIIGQDEDISRISGGNEVKRIIKNFSMQYEDLLRKWDLNSPNERIDANEENIDKIFNYDEEAIQKNPIMKECDLLGYYKVLEASQGEEEAYQVSLLFAREDSDSNKLLKLKQHLKMLEKTLNISVWDRSSIIAGEVDKIAIENIEKSRCVLLLISSSLFIDRIFDAWINYIDFDKQEVIPIVIRKCHWEDMKVSGRRLGDLKCYASLSRIGENQEVEIESYIYDIIESMRKILPVIKK